MYFVQNEHIALQALDNVLGYWHSYLSATLETLSPGRFLGPSSQRSIESTYPAFKPWFEAQEDGRCATFVELYIPVISPLIDALNCTLNSQAPKARQLSLAWNSDTTATALLCYRLSLLRKTFKTPVVLLKPSCQLYVCAHQYIGCNLIRNRRTQLQH